MTHYVGIDLGTTNSAICTFNGDELQLYKSPEQHDVTPSAIFIDKRGNKYVGSRAYNNAARNPDNAATLFKRLIGTSTPIKLSAVDLTMTPEECSSEILKLLFGYLPEEIRNNPDTGTVITVPAAFNQMQKDATMSAAEMAGIGRVALMQEPVAATMSVMRQRRGDGVFLVYDLGGGTLDIAIAESISGRVSLLAHGGIAMCGGRDFDRILFDNVVKPWLRNNFDLPEDLTANAQYKPLLRLSTWAAEKAKVELSQKEEAIIGLSETELGIRDLAGEEIYLDIPLDRTTLNNLINPKLQESIDSVRETMDKAGLGPHDIERIVFVGGPTQYKPLRDKIAFELGISPSTDVNPMTAVAEGAAVFAESIDWSTKSRGRKQTRGQVNLTGQLEVSFNYPARTPDSKAKIVAKISGSVLPGSEFQIDSLDTGWSSGRVLLDSGSSVEVSLSKSGENTFKIFLFDAAGGPLSLENDKICITRTAASIDAIPASSSIGIEVLNKIGGRPTLEYLVKTGDHLPKKGTTTFKAGESLRARGTGSINIKVWEGEIEDPITDNRHIGSLIITGSHFEQGVIAAGADLICDYEILDSGNVFLEISVPSIGSTFHSNENFYSRQTAQIDYSSAAQLVVEDAEVTLNRVRDIKSKIDNTKLEQALDKLEQACSLSESESDPENTKQAMDNILDAKKILSQVRKEHLKEIRQLDLDRVKDFFDETISQYARATEISSFNNLLHTAERAIANNSPDFEMLLDDLRSKNFYILWRQDWFVIDRFNNLAKNSYLFPDKQKHTDLVNLGEDALRQDDIDKLRSIVSELDSIRFNIGAIDDLNVEANIVRS